MRLVYPPSVTGSSDPPLLTLLQGPVQRVDLLFTSDSCVKAGKIYLQIDATPNSAAAAGDALGGVAAAALPSLSTRGRVRGTEDCRRAEKE